MSPCTPTAQPDGAPDVESAGAAARFGNGVSMPGLNTRVVETWIIEHGQDDPVATIEAVIEGYAKDQNVCGDSEQGGWIVMLSYELGRVIEPNAQHDIEKSCPKPTGFPLVVIQRLEACPNPIVDLHDEFEFGSLESSMGKAGYIAAVERTKSYIRDGDIYQANIAHQLAASFHGNARSCFQALYIASKPEHGALMVFDYQGIRHAIASISPELFIRCNFQTRTIQTEPMKGTRPIGSDEHELRESVKDRAELDMITDLMRNDLGRVCVLGSVNVVEPRKIESHQSGVLQASSVIQGRLIDGVRLGDIIRATFPPGSVTGAPKVRAMQIIDEIENAARNSYCGALLMLDDSGRMNSSVSIRTAHIWGGVDPKDTDSVQNGQFVYPVGAGIVADSIPSDEWAETLVKAKVLEHGLGLDLSVVQ